MSQRKDKKVTLLSTRDHLDKYGICTFKEVINPAQVEALKTLCINNEYGTVKKYIQTCPNIVDTIRAMLGSDYEFQDYVFIIKKSSIHTCHRDANGDMFNEGQQHPSYTVLLYLEDIEGGCLGVIPGSHDGRSLNLTEGLYSVVCSKGDMILFNANLVHAGMLGPKSDNIRIQMKMTHKDDRAVIDYYENFNKVAERDNTLPMSIKKVHQQLSCLAPALADLSQGEIRDSGTSTSKKVFSKIVYGDSGFYDLPDAF